MIKRKIVLFCAGMLCISLLCACQREETAKTTSVQGSAVAGHKQEVHLLEELEPIDDLQSEIDGDLQDMEETDALAEKMLDSKTALSVSDYPWATQAQRLLKRFFQDKYSRDITEMLNAVQLYQIDVGENDWIDGFYASQYHAIFINQKNLHRYTDDRNCHIYLHELLHAMIGLHEKQEKSGAVSLGFYEGLVEALTKEILQTYTGSYEDFSIYSEVQTETAYEIWNADSEILTALVFEKQWDVAGRVDAVLGDGVGKILLKCEFLLQNQETDERIVHNLNVITQAYRKAKIDA